MCINKEQLPKIFLMNEEIFNTTANDTEIHYVTKNTYSQHERIYFRTIHIYTSTEMNFI